MSKKVLVIDDDKDLVTYFVALLKDHGFETASAGDGVEGLQKVLSEKPDLIMLDITMPEKSGVRFYRDVRENAATAKIPVVMVTGVMEEFKQFISKRKQVPPPEAYFSKPVDKNELIAKIKELLG
jgi:CheY-like chemotaxis protein